jgi:hypothetical protein
MSKKFWAVNRLTGEKWKPKKIPDTPPFKGRQYLMLWDSGYPAVVTEDFYLTMEPLDMKVWKLVWKDRPDKD